MPYLYFSSLLQRLSNFPTKNRYEQWIQEFLLFGLKQAWACLFGGTLLFLIIVTKYLWPVDALVTRYDFLFFSALMIQLLLILTKLETLEEAKVIFIFHVVGTIMEVFKTAQGSWVYPEESIFHIGNVPLFSGFMYASVGSYIARATRIFQLSYAHYPSNRHVFLLALLIYINFFSHHYILDIRNVIFIWVIILFYKTTVYFTPGPTRRQMPLLVGFVLIACFIWVGENIGTYTHSWLYPGQKTSWHLVSLGKLGSWFLLMLISFALVSIIHPPNTTSKNSPDNAN